MAVTLGILIYLLLGILTAVGLNCILESRFREDDSGIAVGIVLLWWLVLIIAVGVNGASWLAKGIDKLSDLVDHWLARS